MCNIMLIPIAITDMNLCKGYAVGMNTILDRVSHMEGGSISKDSQMSGVM